MGKAYRTDAAAVPPIAAEIQQLMQRVDIMPAEEVTCPIEGSRVMYQLCNYMFSDRRANLDTLMNGLRGHHPQHPATFILNEPRAD